MVLKVKVLNFESASSGWAALCRKRFWVWDGKDVNSVDILFKVTSRKLKSSFEIWESCLRKSTVPVGCFIVLVNKRFWYTESYGRLRLECLPTMLHVFLTLQRYTQIKSFSLRIVGILNLSNQISNFSKNWRKPEKQDFTNNTSEFYRPIVIQVQK